MNPSNPLQKYYRQPKIYISLPSKGLYYPPGVLTGDYNHVPVFAMNGMDEIIMKTPDALFSGTATSKVIESCCPYITDAQKIPSIDVDALIVAIRIATYGDIMSVEKTCSNCQTENTYEIQLQDIIDRQNTLKFQNVVSVVDDINIKIRPLSYFEMNHYGMENFKLQKTLSQLDALPDDEKQIKLNEIFEDLAELQVDLFITTIESVSTPDGVVTDKAFISDWLRNCDREIYNQIKNKIEANRDEWEIPSQQVVCASCQTKDSINLILDQSNFFA